jgi:hypothetical protein
MDDHVRGGGGERQKAKSQEGERNDSGKDFHGRKLAREAVQWGDAL